MYLISLIPLNVHIGEVHCSKCHRRSGRGRGKSFLPLAQSGYLLVDPDRAIRVIWFGLAGPITVNGQRYDAAMAPVSLTEQEVADVMNYHSASTSHPSMAFFSLEKLTPTPSNALPRPR